MNGFTIGKNATNIITTCCWQKNNIELVVVIVFVYVLPQNKQIYVETLREKCDTVLIELSLNIK